MLLYASLLIAAMSAADAAPSAADAEPQPPQQPTTTVERIQQRMQDRRAARQKLRSEWLKNTASQQEVLLVGAVEKVLSYVLDAPTSVGSLKLDAQMGHIQLTELCIGNPGDFDSSTDAILMDKAVLEADPTLLFSKEPLIHLVEATGVTVNSETSLKGNNLKRLLDNASRFAGGKSGGLKLGQGSEKTWRIEKGVLGGVTLNMITNLLNKQTKQKTIEPIEMSFIGEDGKGMTASQAISKVLERLLSETGILEKGLGDSPLGGILGDILSGTGK